MTSKEDRMSIMMTTDCYAQLDGPDEKRSHPKLIKNLTKSYQCESNQNVNDQL